MNLPRGICPWCGRSVALRKGGLVREHHLGAELCPGSGLDANVQWLVVAQDADWMRDRAIEDAWEPDGVDCAGPVEQQP